MRSFFLALVFLTCLCGSAHADIKDQAYPYECQGKSSPKPLYCKIIPTLGDDDVVHGVTCKINNVLLMAKGDGECKIAGGVVTHVVVAKHGADVKELPVVGGNIQISGNIAPDDTFVLAVGSCPPWKGNHLSLCKASVKAITSALERRLKIPKNNIKILTGNNSTYEDVQKGLAWLKKKTNDKKLAILYMNLHGGSYALDAAPTAKEHEAFLLWTKDKPFTVETALSEKLWMNSSELRSALDDIDAEKIVIIDACHSGASEGDMDNRHPLVSGADKREAFIFSAHTIQEAQFSKDEKMALFTEHLSEVIENGAADLASAFKLAKEKTKSDAIQMCDSNPGYAAIPKEKCRQVPVMYDHSGILDGIKFRK